MNIEKFAIIGKDDIRCNLLFQNYGKAESILNWSGLSPYDTIEPVRILDIETFSNLEKGFEAATLCIFDIKEYLNNLPVDASRQQIKNGLLKLINQSKNQLS